MDYRTLTEITPQSSSRGIGFFKIETVESLSVSQVFDYLEQHPNDSFMHSVLEGFSFSNRGVIVAEALSRFRQNPSIISFGVLVRTNTQEYPDVVATLMGCTDKAKVLGFFANHYSMDVRGYAQHEYLVAKQQWEYIFRENRDKHISLDQFTGIRLPVLPHFLNSSIQNPVHVRNFSSQTDGDSIKTGTSLRTVTPDETYERINQLPLDSIVSQDSQIICIRSGGIFTAQVPWQLHLVNSGGNQTYSLHGNAGSGGKGFTPTAAIVSGLMETLERYSAGAGCTPNFPQGYVETQTLRKMRQSNFVSEGSHFLDLDSLCLTIPYQDHELYWVRGIEKSSNGTRPIYVPAQLVYMFSNFDEVSIVNGSSNGLASGNTLNEAKLHSLFEIVERDGDYTFFYSPDRVFTLTAEDEQISEILGVYAKKGITIQVLDLTSELGIPTYRAFVQLGTQVLSGSGAHLDGKIAVMRAVCELAPKLFMYRITNNGFSNSVISPVENAHLVAYEDLPNYSSGNIEADLVITECTLIANDFNPIYVNLTREDIQIPVVRSIVPGLEMPEGISKRRYHNFVSQSNLHILQP